MLLLFDKSESLKCAKVVVLKLGAILFYFQIHFKPLKLWKKIWIGTFHKRWTNSPRWHLLEGTPSIWNKSYMNCGNEMKMEKWSSQWMQFMQLRKEAWKKNRDLAISVRCSANWAMKPLTLGAGQLWVHMFPWKKWVLMIYEINHIWTTEMKWKWRNRVIRNNLR